MSCDTDAKVTSRLGKVAVINAPSTYAIIWNVMKPWLSKEIASKVDILGSDYKDVLLELIDAENLPTSLGGTCTCAGAGGCQFSGAGPWQEGRVGWGPKAQGLTNTTESHPSMLVNGVPLPAAEDA